MPFKKGDPNINRSGRPKKGQSFGEIFQQVGEEFAGDSPYTRKEAIARILWKKAFDGDLKAIEILLDRMDGKARQIVEAHMKQIQINLDKDDIDAAT
jgi:hypothetical protein